MQPLFLKLDDSLEYQGALGAAAEPSRGRVIDASDLGPLLRLWARPSELLVLEHRLRSKPAGGPELVFAGSSDFHHLTPILLRRALKACGAASATVVHIGAPIEDRGAPQSRAWSAALAEQPGVASLVSYDGRGDRPVASRYLYFTIDKSTFTTGDQAAQHLETAVRTMARGHRVIGAEVFGDWSTPKFAGGRAFALIKQLTAMAGIAKPIDEHAARAADQALNIRILEMFANLAEAEGPVRLARAH
jgi:hypothetical protein